IQFSKTIFPATPEALEVGPAASVNGLIRGPQQSVKQNSQGTYQQGKCRFSAAKKTNPRYSLRIALE
ncbi:hypothetical protein, partial [Gluconobacter oxydans]